MKKTAPKIKTKLPPKATSGCTSTGRNQKVKLKITTARRRLSTFEECKPNLINSQTPKTCNHKSSQSFLLSIFQCFFISLVALAAADCTQATPFFNSPQQSADSQLTRDNLVAQQYHQHDNKLQFYVMERTPNNTHIGRIKSADNQLPSLIVPSATTPESERLAALRIDLATGDLFTNKELDREERAEYSFVAIVPQPFGEIRCTVTVKDVNDNQPKFIMPNPNETTYIVEVPEGQRGIRRALPIAIDVDSSPLGIKEFRIVSGHTPAGAFILADHGAPPRSSISHLQPGLDDALSAPTLSDNPVLVEEFARQATVLIPSPPGTSSLHLSSAAAASRPQSPSAVNLAEPMQSAAGGQTKYLIDLEVNHTLDREQQSSYQLSVQAIDGGQPPLVGELNVTVIVSDVNDNEPVFREKLYEVSCKEDTPKGARLLHVHATDADLDANAQISYYIKHHSSSSQIINPGDMYDTSSNNNNNKYGKRSSSSNQQTLTATSKQRNTPDLQATDQMFEIDPNKGDIILKHSLDFETDQVHELFIEARDHGKPPRSGYTTVKIQVLDVDDAPPVSAQPSSQQSLGHSLDDRKSANGSPILDPSPLYKDGPPEIFKTLLESLSSSGWLAQINSISVFVIVLCAILVSAFSFCLVKIKSRQLESDYNDTAGLTMSPGANGQTKPSPNHSTSSEHPNGGVGGVVGGDPHHRSAGAHHHGEHQRRSGSQIAGFGGLMLGSGYAASQSGKLRQYHYSHDSSNLYQNFSTHHSIEPRLSSSSHMQAVSQQQHQQPDSPRDVSRGGGGSGANTMTLHSHAAAHLLSSPGGAGIGGHSHLDSMHHQFSSPAPGVGHHSSSLTYAHHHSRAAAAALLHQAHHHQSSHHLSAVHHSQLVNKGGTMNSVGTQHSLALGGHPSASPLAETPNTTHSSALPSSALHESVNCHGPPGHAGAPLLALPATPPAQCPNQAAHHAVSTGPMWPNSSSGPSLDNCGSMTPPLSASQMQPLDRWFDLAGVSSQLVYAHDLYGSYNWDYLQDWAPEYYNLLQLIQTSEGAAY